MRKDFKLFVGLCLVILASCEVSTTSSLLDTSSESSIELNSFPTYDYEDLFKTKTTKPNPGENDPHFTTDKDEYVLAENIEITSYNCGENDWVGLYPYGGYPQDITALTYLYVNNTTQELKISRLFENETRYCLYLCQNGGYTVLDTKEITITQKSKVDYTALSAKYLYEDGEMKVSITPCSGTKLITYQVYWAKDGVRLEDYSYIKMFKKKSDGEFTMSLGKNLIMPNEANQIEVFACLGDSKSIFVPATNEAKLRKSNYLYSFNVYTDIHVQDYEIKPNHVDHIQKALNDAYCYNRNSKALISLGDQTDAGSVNNWETITGIFDTYKEKSGVPIYCALGNHEYMYNGNYNSQIDLFTTYSNQSSIFYTKELEGSTCIFLGSDAKTTNGEITQEHIDWLKEQLDAADKTKPIYVFLHQPLLNTVAGSYSNQGWFLVDGNNRIKTLLSNYNNTFMFSGHTHWQMESKNNVQFNETGASYINCASVGYLWNDSDTGEPGSEGLFVDVYEDKIVFKGRDFVYDKWLSYANYVVPLVESTNTI